MIEPLKSLKDKINDEATEIEKDIEKVAKKAKAEVGKKIKSKKTK